MVTELWAKSKLIEIGSLRFVSCCVQVVILV